jgi:hypothetical protein
VNEKKKCRKPRINCIYESKLLFPCHSTSRNFAPPTQHNKMSNLSHSGVAIDPSETFKSYVHDLFRVFKLTPKRPHFQAANSSSSSSGCQQGPMDVTQLQEALAEALRAKDEAIQDRDQLKSHLNSISMNTSAAETPTCLFLERIPREIRNIIYSYLLVSPELSHA